MAIDGNYPMFLENPGTVYNAREFRRFFQSMMGYDVATASGTAAGGVFRPADMAVLENGTPDSTVNVSAGAAYVDGNESATAGGYFVYNDAVVNVAITGADATNPRKDIVGVRIRDTEYSGGTDDAQIVVVTGTPAASPAEPVLPSNFLSLALIDVPASDSIVNQGSITDRRRRMSTLGGIAVCTSTTRPSVTPWAGMAIYETDTLKFGLYTGSEWLSFMGVITCTSSTRPAAPFDGMMIWETDTHVMRLYTNGQWEWERGPGDWMLWSTTTPPTGHLLCNGAAYSRTVTYNYLFAQISTTWGVGDGSTTFNVPNMNDRVFVGRNGQAPGTNDTSGSYNGGVDHTHNYWKYNATYAVGTSGASAYLHSHTLYSKIVVPVIRY